MVRPLRLEVHGALHHVTSRGDGQENICFDDGERTDCLAVLDEVVKRFNWTVHAYWLMSNHYHLLVETPDGNLAQGMETVVSPCPQLFAMQLSPRLHRYGLVELANALCTWSMS